MARKTSFLSLLCTLCTINNGSSFSLNKARVQSVEKTTIFPEASSLFGPMAEINDKPISKAVTRTIATIPLIFPSIASAVDDYEVAELPPVYVPVLFAIVVIGGVGVLTASLGDVMDEGMCLDDMIEFYCNYIQSHIRHLIFRV
jgi:hypothetical protein